ncbi:hypothetical protein [Methylobacterium sp. Leaf88]|uniref:hypothetical protein n=1 Tax=Methylobacterium sp. Leaf88 TaxID=1736244 RepID=UPI0012E7E117|nr:hypothetical protein [Methylobacterium sp. Leaf88]
MRRQIDRFLLPLLLCISSTAFAGDAVSLTVASTSVRGNGQGRTNPTSWSTSMMAVRRRSRHSRPRLSAVA